MAGKRRSWRRWFWLLLGVVLVVVVIRSLSREGTLLGPFAPDAVAVVHVEGAIESARETVHLLDDLAEDDGVRAVVLRVNSPGGGVAPSQEIYQAIRRVREEKPVVASLGSMAASGGYYVASACDTIVSNPGTLTGSIGVIMYFGNYQELLEKIGVRTYVLKAGEFKDLGSPVRPMSDEEQHLVEGVLHDVHDQFVQAVAEGRGLEIETVRSLSDGRIFSGAQALEHDLVDQLGGLRDAVTEAGERAGLDIPPRRREYYGEAAPWWQRLLGFWGHMTTPGWWGLGYLYTGPVPG